MKTRVQLALFACLLSVLALAYLAVHYYPLKFGFAGGQSICNLNATFDCDAVSASRFAALFGIPMAVWGGATFAVLFFLILIGWLEWTDNPERTRRWALLLAGFSLATSIVMGTISLTALDNLCLFCIFVYFTSAVVFFAYRGELREPFWIHFQRDIRALATESRWILGALIAIPLLAYLTHQMFMQDFSESKLNSLVQSTIAEWQAAPKHEFVAKPSLAMGPPVESATLILSEFADFRCGHCKHASYSLDAFVKAHPDVRFEFYSFPLDGACNDKVAAASGISCRLAEAVLCAEAEGKGWPLHHALFNIQDQVNQISGVAELDMILSKQVALVGLNWERMQSCLGDPATASAIKNQTKQGDLVNVRGTPTIFANGRQLNRAQLLPVLAAARERARESGK